MQITKRDLGESYVVGTGIVLGGVLLAQLLVTGPRVTALGIAGLVPALALVAAIKWFRWFELDSEQIWMVSKGSALAMALMTLPLAGIVYGLQAVALSSGDTILLGVALSSASVAGGLAGLVVELRRTNDRLSLRNAVLDRVLRHNLRNDMTVVLCLLSELEETADPRQRDRIRHARRRVESLVDLTDKVRQITATSGEPPQEAVDLVPIVEERVRAIRDAHPEAEIRTELPATARVRVNEEFGLVLDNVVESALRNGDAAPSLRVTVGVEGTTVRFRIEDRHRSLPEADVSAVSAGTETDLEHGIGVELWLVQWLADANGADLTVETVGDACRVDLRLDAVDGRVTVGGV